MEKSFKYIPIIATLAVYIACMVLALGIEVDERVTALLPDSDPGVADFNTFITQVPAAEALYIQIDAEDPGLLTGAGDAVYDAVKEAPFFTDILYQFSREGVLGLVDLVNRKKFRLLTPEDLAEAENRMAHAEGRLSEIKRQLLSPSGALSAKALARDPLGLDSMVLQKLAAFQAEMPGVKAGQSRMISSDGKSLLMVATPAFPAVETVKSQAMMDRLNQIREEIRRDFKGKVMVRFSGVHPATLDNAATIQADVKRTLMVMTLGLVVMGILFFRRRYHVVLIFVPTLVSLGLAGAAAALFQGRVSAIALGCGALLVGITVDFGIHILFHADTLGTAHTREIIQKLRAPVITGAATTMAAFGCLLFSSLPGQRQMGWISILGIAGAAGFALTLLKYFITIRPWTPSPPLLSLVKFSTALASFRKKHRRLLLLVCLGLALAGAAGLPDFSFEGDVAALNHLRPETREDMDRFLATWGQTPVTLFMVTGETTDQALEKNDALFRELKTMEGEGKLSGIASLSDILPSRVEQDRRLADAAGMFSPGKIREIREDLLRAGSRTGFAPSAFAPFLQDLEAVSGGAVPPVTLKDLQRTVVAPLMGAKLMVKPDRTLALTTARIEDKALIPAISQEIKNQIPGTLVIDKPWFIQRVTALVAEEFTDFLVWACLAMVAVLWICQRRVRVVAAIIAPVSLSAVITAGLLGLAGIPVNLISIVFIIFVFGVGVDYAIFLIHHELAGSVTTRVRPDREITPGAVMLCAMTTIGAFASLCFASHRALFSIGVAGLTGMSVSLVMAMVIIPILVEAWDLGRENGPGEKRRSDGRH